MSTTTLPQRKRDRLKSFLPGRPKPVSPDPPAATVSSSSSQGWRHSDSVALTPNSTTRSVSSPSASTSAAAITPQQATLVISAVSPTTSNFSTNPAFLAAIQKHLDKVSEVERQAFYQANITISPDSLLERIRSLDTQHASNSSFRPCADKVARCLGLLDRLLGGVAIAVQANPDISSIAVGGVKLIVDIAAGFAKFFGKFADMLDRLSEIIAPLERYAQRFELLNVGNALMDVYGDVLDFCKASSALFLDRDGKSKAHTTLQTFLHTQWAPFETEFGEIACRMDRHCGVLLHAAQAELLYADKVKERESLLRWLSPYDFQHKQYLTFKTKHRGTGDWLLQTDEFSQWQRATSSQLLWCYGKPGAGKSILASHVINHIHTNHVGQQTGLCFAYFSFADPIFQDLTLLISLFLKQLCQQQGAIPEKLLEAKRQAREPASVSDLAMFAGVTKLYHRVFIVVDGLDECPEERRQPILDFIVEVLSNPESNNKIFVSSRKEPDISAQFRYLDTPAIELETARINPDIRSFVQHETLRLRAESKLRVRNDDLFEEIIEKLVEKSDGMFLWASLQLQQLCKTSRSDNDQHLRQALDHLPQGLVAMYTRIFDEIFKGPLHFQHIALECFRWTVYAKHPPSLNTLRAAIALLDSPRTEEEFQLRLLSPEYISEACQNLLRLPSRLHHQIVPIHFSFLEYLQNLPLDKLQGNLWEPLADRPNAESILACRCMDWLLLALPYDLGDVTAWGQLTYPIRFFDKHAIRAISGSVRSADNLLASTRRLLDTDDRKLASLVKLRLGQTRLGQEALGRSFDEALSRHYLLWTSDLHLLPGLNVDWSKLATPKYALHLAVMFRPEKLDYLLSNGQSPNELDEHERTPLWYACDQGYVTSAQSLLRAGATLCADVDGLSPLHRAILQDHLEVAKLLLQTDTHSATWSGPFGRTLLMMARSLDMVKFLCEAYDSDINATNDTGVPVLGYFVGARKHIRWVKNADSTRILEYLIGRGADMFVKSKAGMNLVDYAVCRKDNAELIGLLLNREPELVKKEAHEWTCLHWACRKGNIRMVKLLLEHGVEVKKLTTLQSPQNWTPYDILMHYDEADVQTGDESILYTLGRAKEVDLNAHLPEDHINYSQLVVEKYPSLIMCHLCAMEVLVGFMFDCAACGGKACLMCNHTLHVQHPDHDPKTLYLGKSAPWGTRYGQRFMVKLPYAINLKCPGWQSWLKQLEHQHRDEYFTSKAATGSDTRDPLARMRAKLWAVVKSRQMSE